MPLIDIINYIQNSIDVLVDLRATEKYEKKLENDESKNKYINYEDKNDENGLKLYEGMLINTEKKIREHIRVRILKFIFPLFLAWTWIEINYRTTWKWTWRNKKGINRFIFMC